MDALEGSAGGEAAGTQQLLLQCSWDGEGEAFSVRAPLSGIGTGLSKFKCNFLKQKQSRIRQFNLDNGVCKEWLLYLF